MSENKDNKLTLINEKTANDYLTHTEAGKELTLAFGSLILGIRKKITAVKRRVHLWKRYRELRQVKGSTGK